LGGLGLASASAAAVSAMSIADSSGRIRRTDSVAVVFHR
jgi:hypothetical protein